MRWHCSICLIFHRSRIIYHDKNIWRFCITRWWFDSTSIRSTTFQTIYIGFQPMPPPPNYLSLVHPWWCLSICRDSLNLMEDIREVVAELEQEQQMAPINVELVDNELSIIYMNSKKSEVRIPVGNWKYKFINFWLTCTSNVSLWAGRALF